MGEGDNVRRYVPDWEQYGIDRERYLELLHMCRQYPLWKRKLEKRERFTAKISMIEGCALDVGDGSWAKALIQNICYGQGYHMIDPLIMPTSHRQTFFKRRKEFFILLNERAERK